MYTKAIIYCSVYTILYMYSFSQAVTIVYYHNYDTTVIAIIIQCNLSIQSLAIAAKSSGTHGLIDSL